MIYVNLICILFLILIFFISKSYKKEEIINLDYKNHPLKLLYSFSLFILDKFINRFPKGGSFSNSDRVAEALEALSLSEKSYNLKRIYESKKIALVFTIIFIANVFSLVLYFNESTDGKKLLGGKYLERADYGEGSSSADLHVRVESDKELILDEDMEIEIIERQLTESEINEILEEGSKYIDSIILSDNTNGDNITSDLYFPSSIPSKGIKVTWTTENRDIIDTKGQVYNQELDHGKLLWVKAILKVKDREALYIRYFKVHPKKYTKKEIIQKQLLEEIEENNQNTLTENKLELPTEVGEQNITWSMVRKKEGGSLLILGVLAAVLIYFFMDKDLWTRVDKKNQEMLLDYPDIINKFTLLVGAGMSLSNAWKKISRDYSEGGGAYKYAYEEMNITARELSIGVSEITAYERFGRRVKLLPYLRFSSFLARNVKKGSKDLLEQLELESLEAFEERKELAKRLGEEAGTKLLIPMMFMLVMVLAIILVPAFLSFQF